MAEYRYSEGSVQAPPPDPREAIQEVLRAIKRNLVRVTFTVAVMLMVGYGLAQVWPNKFESSTEFVLRQDRFIEGDLRKELANVPLPKKLQTLENELKSRRRIDAVMAELQWVEWLETAGKEAQRKELRDKLKDNLSVSMEPDAIGAHHITIAFRWTRQSKAADFVNTLRDHWITLTLDNHRQGVEDHKERLEAIVADREGAYHSALRARQKFETEHDVPRLLTPEVNNQLKAELLTKVTEAKVQLDSAVEIVERLERELTEIPPTIPMPPQARSPEHAAALARFATAQAAFDRAGKQYTDRHPAYRKAEDAYKEAKKALAALGTDVGAGASEVQGNPAYFEKVGQWEAARDTETKYRAQVARYEEELDAVQARLDAWPMVSQELQRLDDDVKLQSTLLEVAKQEVQPYRDQVSQLRAMRFTSDDDLGNVGPFEILEVGVAPDTPVLPVGAIIMAIALVAGVTLGVAGPILAELTRSSYGSVKEVSRTLGVPVLGAVDLILTRRDVRARTIQQSLSITTMVLVLAAMGTALYIYTNLPDVLPASLHNFVRDMRIALT